MDQIGPRALDDIVEMLTLIAERTDMIGNSAATVGTVTISLLLALSILCVVGSGYFAYFLSSRIGNAIGDSIEDMQSLAAGNIDLEIRGTDSETEL